MVCLVAACLCAPAQPRSPVQQAVYRNPILFADYSDPDVIRDGLNYYLVASTFHFVPGIPILQSTDLVHWTIMGHVVQRMDMDPRYSMMGGNRYGKECGRRRSASTTAFTMSTFRLRAKAFS